MKTLIFATLAVMLATALPAAAQVKSGSTSPSSTAPSLAAADQNPTTTTRARVLKTDAKPTGTEVTPVPSLQAHAKNDLNAEPSRARRADMPASNSSSNAPAAKATTPVSLPTVSVASTQVYRVGAQDVLDIQLVGSMSKESTLFTVMENGLLEYPLAGSPIAAAGLTTQEIGNILRQRIKVFENPTVTVAVRDYASHQITITGFVGSPGTKVLRREAVPLYAILAESQLLPEAARATITRAGRPSIVADLKDSNHTSTLIVPGDVIKVNGLPPAPTEFFFIGGAVNAPGQKPFHAGITLTQAILASGGTNAKAGDRVRVSGLGANGRLISEEHSLRRIQSGKDPDPSLQKGDRVELYSAN